MIPAVANDVGDWLTRWAPTLGVGAATLVAVAAGSRWLLVQLALRRRTAICQLLPTDTFDPSLEEVGRFAGVLARVHRVSRSLGGREATAVRVRLSSVDGTLVYSLEGPARATSLLRNPGFAEVEARPVEAEAGVVDRSEDAGQERAVPPGTEGREVDEDSTLVEGDLTVVGERRG